MNFFQDVCYTCAPWPKKISSDGILMFKRCQCHLSANTMYEASDNSQLTIFFIGPKSTVRITLMTSYRHYASADGAS